MNKRYYLDTSALVKRYVEEPGSRLVDEIFQEAHAGLAVIVLSYWNLGEASVVFDKYRETLGLNMVNVFKIMLRELRMLCRAHTTILTNITPRIIKNSINLVFKHHIYVADAVQITSAKHVGATKLVTGDRRLAEICEVEGLETLHVA